MDSEAAAASETAAANETYEELYVSPTCHVQTAEDRVSLTYSYYGSRRG